MIYRKLTSNGDYSFGNNKEDFLEGDLALAQAIKTRILLFYQEWWEDLNNGIPMFQNIIGQVNRNNIEVALQSLLIKRIQEFPEVSEAKVSLVGIDGRTLTMQIECQLASQESIEFEIEI